MAIIRKNGMEAEVSVEELRALFGVTDGPVTLPAKSIAPIARTAEPRRRTSARATAEDTTPIDPAKQRVAMEVFSQQSPKGKRLATLFIERRAQGVPQHELVELLHVTAPQASRLIRNWREAALTAGLKESAFVRFEREGRGKRWYATNLLTAALTISPQKPIPEPAEERA